MTMRFVTAATLVASLALVSGCGQPAAAPPAGGAGSTNGASATQASAAKETASEHAHDGWWCTEHGIPEGICAQCNSKVAADFQKKGDWCKEHDRPESQCFICHPELEAKFASQYVAKYGKEPPKREE